MSCMNAYGNEPIAEDAISHESIDLGLSVEWATCNVGANAPEEFGGYFAWGETEEKDSYKKSNYKLQDFTLDSTMTDISGTQYDVAHVRWGGDWRMPTLDEFDELCRRCTWKWTTLNDVSGYLVTGPNGNSIFLPAADECRYSDIELLEVVTDTTRYAVEANTPNLPTFGFYWSASPFWGTGGACFYFSNKETDFSPSFLRENHIGRSIRPVKTKPTSKKKAVMIKGHEAVDLGLSVKWAACNVGANAPEEPGGYFAWGETEEKGNYAMETYKWGNGRSWDSQTAGYCVKYCTNSKEGIVDNKTTLEPKDDVARVKWGGDWRMPTRDEFKELVDSCTWKWTIFNGVKGHLVIGPNGNRIFLPATGNRGNTGIYDVGRSGYYWTGTLDGSSNYDANSIELFENFRMLNQKKQYRRYRGLAVRPVAE